MESGGEKKEEKGPITFPPRSHYRSNILWGQYFIQYLKSNLKSTPIHSKYSQRGYVVG